VFFSSDVLLDEILGIANIVKREKALLLYHSAAIHISLSDNIVTRAREFEQFQINPYDALQLSGAEIGGADVFLTTDRKLINAAGRSDVKIKVKNPLIWLTEVLYER